MSKEKLGYNPGLKVPYNNHGLVEYLSSWDLNDEETDFHEKRQKEGYRFEANDPFTDTLRIIGYHRGRSAAGLTLEREDGRKYYMFVSDTVDMLRTAVSIRGHVLGKWAVVKKGTNYGVKLLEAIGA